MISPLTMSPGDPWKWLKLGVSDLYACHYRSLFYGVCFALMGFGIDHAHAGNKALALAVAAGFLFAGPFLSTGLYELSRQRQAGESLELVLSLFSWCRNPSAIGRFAMFLSPIMVIWLGLSVPLFGTITHQFSVTTALLSLLWLTLALLVFTASVISIPMMLDKQVSAKHAIMVSVKSCMKNWKTYALWALMIVLITGTSLVLGYWPLIITGPILGHASWHAYQAISCSTNEHRCT